MTTPEQLPLDVAAAAGASPTAAIASQGDVVVRGDAEPGGRAAVLDLRLDHGALGLLLQVRELRHHERAARSLRDSGLVVRIRVRGPAEAGRNRPGASFVVSGFSDES